MDNQHQVTVSATATATSSDRVPGSAAGEHTSPLLFPTMARPMGITAIAVDEHPLFRSGLRAALTRTPDMSLVGEAASASEALALIRALEPDVALVDIALSDGDAIGLTHQLTTEDVRTRVLILSVQATDLLMSRAHAAGAAGMLAKTHTPDDIVDAIRAVASGGRRYDTASFEPPLTVNPENARRARRFALDPLSVLSPRERVVFDAMVRGLSCKEIASEMKVSPKTVESHTTRINAKLHFRSRGDAIRFAALSGLISGGPPRRPA